MKPRSWFDIYFAAVPEDIDHGYCRVRLTFNKSQTQCYTSGGRGNDYFIELNRRDTPRMRAWLELLPLTPLRFVDGSESQVEMRLDYQHFAGIWALAQSLEMEPVQQRLKRSPADLSC